MDQNSENKTKKRRLSEQAKQYYIIKPLKHAAILSVALTMYYMVLVKLHCNYVPWDAPLYAFFIYDIIDDAPSWYLINDFLFTIIESFFGIFILIATAIYQNNWHDLVNLEIYLWIELTGASVFTPVLFWCLIKRKYRKYSVLVALYILFLPMFSIQYVDIYDISEFFWDPYIGYCSRIEGLTINLGGSAAGLQSVKFGSI